MSNADWYAKKFGTPPTGVPDAPPLMIPNPYYQQGQQPQYYQQPQQPQQPYYPPQVPQPGAPQNYGYNVPGGQPLYDPHLEAAMRMATSATLGTTCPTCRSGNYMKVGTQSNQNGQFDVMRCFDCGYPKVQQGSGVGGISTSGQGGKAIPARGQSTGSFQPHTIVDRIG